MLSLVTAPGLPLLRPTTVLGVMACVTGAGCSIALGAGDVIFVAVAGRGAIIIFGEGIATSMDEMEDMFSRGFCMLQVNALAAYVGHSIHALLTRSFAAAAAIAASHPGCSMKSGAQNFCIADGAGSASEAGF